MVQVNKPEEQFDRKVFDEFCKKYELTLPNAFINYLAINNTGELESNIVKTYEDFSVRFFLELPQKAMIMLKRIICAMQKEFRKIVFR